MCQSPAALCSTVTSENSSEAPPAGREWICMFNKLLLWVGIHAILEAVVSEPDF